MVPVSGKIQFVILWDKTAEIDEEAFVARVYSDTDLKQAKIELCGYRLLEQEFDSKKQLKQYLLTVLIHEMTHFYFADYFEMLNAPKNQKKFLFERISYLVEEVVNRLLDSWNIKQWLK